MHEDDRARARSRRTRTPRSRSSGSPPRPCRDHGVPAVGLRFFSVYGPRQRPDMAFQRFLERAARGPPLEVFGDGSQRRDFTYVGDVVDATLSPRAAAPRGAVYNVGGGQPASLSRVLALSASCSSAS